MVNHVPSGPGSHEASTGNDQPRTSPNQTKSCSFAAILQLDIAVHEYFAAGIPVFREGDCDPTRDLRLWSVRIVRCDKHRSLDLARKLGILQRPFYPNILIHGSAPCFQFCGKLRETSSPWQGHRRGCIAAMRYSRHERNATASFPLQIQLRIASHLARWLEGRILNSEMDHHRRHVWTSQNVHR